MFSKDAIFGYRVFKKRYLPPFWQHCTQRQFGVGNLLTGRAIVTEELEVENYSLLACVLTVDSIACK